MKTIIESKKMVKDKYLKISGGKGTNLLKLKKIGFNVPDFFIISTENYRSFLERNKLEDKIKKILNTNIDSPHSKIEELFLTSSHSKKFIKDLKKHFDKMNKKFLAVRSSAEIEDNKNYSFAGLLSSYLYINTFKDLEVSIKKCWASFFSDRSIKYIKMKGINIFKYSVAVVVQDMVNASCSGVMFTVNPDKNNYEEIVIDTVFGIGEGLVSGLLDADHFVVDRKKCEIKTEYIAKKEQMLIYDIEKGSGLKATNIKKSEINKKSIDNETIKNLSMIGTKIEKYFRYPQDIEWAVSNGKIYILQSRPITSIDINNNILIWDNSNISESYGGITSPMTFSLAKHFYYHGFRGTLLSAGIPLKNINKVDKYLKNMLGYIDGRIYYNLMSIYNVMSLLPGVRHYNVFWEEMLDIKESLPNFLKETLTFSDRKKTLFDKYIKTKLIFKAFSKYIGFQNNVEKFTEKVNNVYNEYYPIDLENKNLVVLLGMIRKLEHLLLTKWHEPNINDFFAISFFGILTKLTEKFIGKDSNLHNELIAGETNIISTEPIKRLLNIISYIKNNLDYSKLFENDSSNEILNEIRSNNKYLKLKQLIDLYIQDFGFRCMNELKFEAIDIYSNPSYLIVMIKNYLNKRDSDVKSIFASGINIREKAEKVLSKKLSGFKLLIYRFILSQSRRFIRNRENLRFLRTKMYGIIRRVLNASGEYFKKEQMINEKKDIFYLTYQELFSVVDGTLITKNLKLIIEERKKEQEKFKKIESHNRFVTTGIIYNTDKYYKKDDVNIKNEKQLKGISCCSGKISGKVKVITSPDQDLELNGEILVTERTDPGWVVLYPSVSAILIEKGSLVSHSAIVAREMGIPTIVSIPNLTRRLKTGDEVMVDATNGIVTILN